MTYDWILDKDKAERRPEECSCTDWALHGHFPVQRVLSEPLAVHGWVQLEVLLLVREEEALQGVHEPAGLLQGVCHRNQLEHGRRGATKGANRIRTAWKDTVAIDSREQVGGEGRRVIQGEAMTVWECMALVMIYQFTITLFTELYANCEFMSLYHYIFFTGR